MRIKIGIWTYTSVISADADGETKTFSVNGNTVPFSQEFLEKSVALVKEWPDHVEDSLVDGVIYKISYNDGENSRTITGNNKTPDNFDKLVEMIHQFIPKTKEEIEKEEWAKLFDSQINNNTRSIME